MQGSSSDCRPVGTLICRREREQTHGDSSDDQSLITQNLEGRESFDPANHQEQFKLDLCPLKIE